ncbi:hypothetical protein [Exiguobacterium sp. Leaf196]|jgi:hypothetical protein|uniref:hypothetical protein n=1 Tax=Exiguobacterium sp. Leaf196 TaxID=1736298 RepID=UPI0006F6309F|nr:hypothetical protein [Exiguobacterium sp. Leaf196]KQS37774.1 hypothetical protein ASG02_12425 [Exiguobacterium sp. Leaf196]
MYKLSFLILVFAAGVWGIVTYDFDNLMPFWILLIFGWAKQFRFNLPIIMPALETTQSTFSQKTYERFTPPTHTVTSQHKIKPYIQDLLHDHSATMNIIQNYYNQSGSIDHQLLHALERKLVSELEPYVTPLLLETSVFMDLLRGEVRRYVRQNK